MTDETGAGALQASAGQMIRAARERRGMHIAVLAAAIKVPQRKLEALEADRHDELPDITFARALALAVCRALKIDAEPVLARLPQGGSAQAQGLVHVAGGLRAPFREHSRRDEPSENALYRRPVFWATGLVLVAAAALGLAPDNLWQRFEPAPPTPAASEPGPGSLPEGTTAQPAPPLPAGAVTAPPGAESLASEPTSAGGATVLRASAPSWVQVRDATGRVVLSRTLAAREAVQLQGTPPLRLTIGNARATELRFRGQPVDLAPNTGRDNVARLELK
jgi:cytoskeleton protein RodZ